MEKLQNNLAVRLKDESNYYLVACDDRRSVKGDSNTKPGEAAQWIIKGEDPLKRIRLLSIYGKYLAAEGSTGKLIQVDKSKNKDWNRLWRFKETEKGFPKVYLRPSQHDLDYYLMNSYDGKVKWDYFGREKWFCKGLARWVVKIVNKPKPFIEEVEGDDDNKGGIVFQQFLQQVNNNGFSGESSSSYVNSGGNVNRGNGNQYNGDVDIRNVHQGNIVNVFRRI